MCLGLAVGYIESINESLNYLPVKILIEQPIQELKYDGWFSVKSKRAPYGKKVLVCDKDGYIFIGTRVKKSANLFIGEDEVTRNSTFWRFLPNPPFARGAKYEQNKTDKKIVDAYPRIVPINKSSGNPFLDVARKAGGL